MIYKRTDNNHAKIATTLRDLGFTVYNTHEVGRGFPDIVCFKNGEPFFVEVKTQKGTLLEKQKVFLKLCKNSYIVKDIEDCILLANNPLILKEKYEKEESN